MCTYLNFLDYLLFPLKSNNIICVFITYLVFATCAFFKYRFSWCKRLSYSGKLSNSCTKFLPTLSSFVPFHHHFSSHQFFSKNMRIEFFDNSWKCHWMNFLKCHSHTLISNLSRSLAGRRCLTARLRVSPYYRVKRLFTLLYAVYFQNWSQCY